MRAAQDLRLAFEPELDPEPFFEFEPPQYPNPAPPTKHSAPVANNQRRVRAGSS